MGIKKIVVVGGGPAGMMAAIRASQLHQDVTLVEKNSCLGRKLLLSGKGRCNFTNLCDLDSFLKRFSSKAQFLRDAFKKFFNNELINFFEQSGLRHKVERQLRVFPASDKSGSILEVLKKELQKNRVRILYRSRGNEILTQDTAVKGLKFYDGKILAADKIILATGGMSYSFTGSTGDGFRLAEKLGHSIVSLRPGLVPLEAKEKAFKSLEGLTLKNIRIKVCAGKSVISSEVGELLFTGFGISGPLILTLSGRIVDWLDEDRSVFVEIDLKPGLSNEQLNEKLLREFRLNPKKSLKNMLKSLLPQRLASVFLGRAKIEPDKQVSLITKVERQNIILLLKGLRVDILKPLPIEEAMITRGGVSLKQINPRTMESRIVKGLYFAGEMIDVDADTGGFNLQAAFSTGYLAGESAALN